MRKKLKIQNKNDDVYYQDGKIYAPKIVPNPIDVAKEYEDGSYLGLYNIVKVYFKRFSNGEYHITIGGKKNQSSLFLL